MKVLAILGVIAAVVCLILGIAGSFVARGMPPKMLLISARAWLDAAMVANLFSIAFSLLGQKGKS